jgi:hypothetical protein
VPWYTYPAIEYLKQLDFSRSRVFEYGSGNSTRFWASAAAQVVSVEDDERWYLKLRAELPANCHLMLERDLAAYVETIDAYPGGFDVIVVDGAARGGTRLRCARKAVRRLRPGGMVILDNSDWLPESARLLREADLIQVDMTGFVPIAGHTQTTSLFLHREFRIQPKSGRQPMPGPGAVPNVWEHPPTMEPPCVEIDGEWFAGVRRDEPFTIESPEGSRRFRLIVSRINVAGPGCAAIVDVDRGRVLISLTEPSPRAESMEAELARSMRMTWGEFCSFIDGHDKKRYPLTGLAA